MKRFLLILLMMGMPGMAWGTTTTFPVTDIDQWLYSGRADTTTNALRHYPLGQNSSGHFYVTGTEAVLLGDASASQPLECSVDGGAYTTLTTSSGRITLFTGLSDTAHLVDFRVRNAYGGFNFYLIKAGAIEVTGGAPALATDTNYGPVQIIGNMTAGTHNFVTPGTNTVAHNYTSPAGYNNRKGEAIVLKGKAENIKVWIRQLYDNSSRITLSIDGVFSSRNVVAEVPATATWRWVTVASGLDVGTEHEYGIYLGDITDIDAVMFGGTGAEISATAVSDKPRVVFFGDSMVQQTSCAVGDCATSYATLTCIQLGALPHNRGVSGNTTANLDSRIAAETAAIAADLDLLVINIGRNNWSSDSTALDAFKVSYRSCVDKAMANFAGTIICLDTWAAATSGVTRTNVNDRIAEVVTEVADPRVVLLATGTNVVLTSGVNSCEGTHPNFTGCEDMADWLAPELAGYLSSGGGAAYYYQNSKAERPRNWYPIKTPSEWVLAP